MDMVIIDKCWSADQGFFPWCLLNYFVISFLWKEEKGENGVELSSCYTSLAGRHRLAEKELTQIWLELSFFQMPCYCLSLLRT